MSRLLIKEIKTSIAPLPQSLPNLTGGLEKVIKRSRFLDRPLSNCQLHSQCLFSLGLDSDFCRNLANCYLFLQFGLYSISVASPQRCALHKPRRSSWVSPYYVSRLQPLPAAITSRKSYAALIQTARTRWSAPSSGPQLAWVHA